MPLASEPLSRLEVLAEPSRRVLLVDQAKALRLSLTPLLRAAGCEVVSVDSLLAARAELVRGRALAVLVDWRALPADGSVGCDVLRAAPQGADVPVLVVVGDGTPAELLEACARGGAEDCLLGPVRAEELGARLEVLRARTPPPASWRMELRQPRTVMLVGEEAGTPGGVGEDLEACGHHVLFAASFDRAPARLAAVAGAPPHLLLVRTPLPAAEAALQVERLRLGTPLAQVPTVVVTLEEVARAPRPGVEWWSARALAPGQLLARVNTLLRRGRETLRVEERVPFVCPVEFREVGGSAGWTSCYSHALSPGALFVRTLVPARPGAALELRIHLPTTREVLETPGLVAWSNPYAPRSAVSHPFGMGVQFLGMGSQRLMWLLELVRASVCT